jgi:pimeloyl-ACP methyl ester carboxylesterase
MRTSGRPSLTNPPGTLVDVGGFRLHLNGQGTGSPTVVFDAALGGSSLSWMLVQPEVAKLTRACSYDRAGFGWSDAGPMPRSAGRIADELHTLLRRAGEMPPYVLVGHSFGALVARVFAARHASDVAAIVLVEPAFPEDWLQPNDRERQRIERGVNLCRRGSFAARVGLARMVSWLVTAGALAPARAVVALISRGGVARADEEILAPIWKLPREARAVLKHMWTRAAFFDALGSQIASISQSAAEVIDAGEIGDVPLVIVSATNPHPHHVAMQQQLVNRGRLGRRIVASASGHWVPLDQPEVIVDAVCSIVEEIRSA